MTRTTKIYLIELIFMICSLSVSGQVENYVSKNNDGYSSDWINLYQNGRFEFMHDEQCYAYIEKAGNYKISGDSIQIEIFKPVHSKSEIINNQNTDNTVDFVIYVYALKDSSVLNSATGFARDSNRQKYELTEKVDSNGIKSFSLPGDRTLKFLKVYADNYIDCELAFEENLDGDYTIKIYLSEDPLQVTNYTGDTYKKEVIMFNGENQLIYNGKTYWRKLN